MPRPPFFVVGLDPESRAADIASMIARITALLATAALALAVPATSSAALPASKVLLIEQGSPIAQVQSLDTVPLGWTSSAGQAVRAAEATGTMRALHSRLHPLEVTPYVWRAQHPFWYVVFRHHGKIVANANVSTAGKVFGVWTGAQARAPYSHGHYASVLTSWLVLLPASLLFMLAFVDLRRPRRIAHLDGLAIL